MKIAEYSRSLQWVGHLACPHCHYRNIGWRSSGMSESFPHFYCAKCSNVSLQGAAKGKVYHATLTPELLAEIAQTLPQCACGGRFQPGAGPKCQSCQQEIPLVADAVQYLRNPNMVLLDGACIFYDNSSLPACQVRIID